MPTPTAPQDPLELLLRAVERTVRAHREFNGVMLVDAIMHLNNAAQYMRTVQKPVQPFPSILLRSCRDVIGLAKEMAAEQNQLSEYHSLKFAGECEEVLEHIKATMEATKS